MIISSNISLKPYNTFGIEAFAKYFTSIRSVQNIQELLRDATYQNNARLILGGGSNMLLTKNVGAFVIKNDIEGIEVIKETEDHVLVKCAAGEVWHKFVMWCIDRNYGGLENLSLIPGCTGASPMQNIGAYGVEIKDTFYELEAVHAVTGELKTFSKTECEFGYRESVFKHRFKNQFIITSVTFKLSKTPVFHVEYGAIKQELDAMKISELSIKVISQAVINIRSSKLPNPKEIGNAGSFFKNPEVSSEVYNRLKINFPNLVAYPLDNSNYKLAAGWLIEQSGLKGYRKGDAGVHKLQALVLVNYGNASGNEIYDLSTHVLQTVKDKFGIELEREVNII
ncbi:MAG: UDP-N-acetylenolpyruvoylglucosamine reductase [Bacteroidetes bacterium]|jgi:UDP-N-acetylmuramate dehydrogenase|nr:UDP-N-acetylenolpyruvoylglucosamine reductase [Bacteroidota bacterium]MDF2451612.1 UDP-N-acetylenolpyruvoylglucosamine reductase [Bacteroidota bacterium]